MNKNWIIRSATGIVYIAVIVAGILLGDGYFLAMSLLLAVPAILEFRRVTLKEVHESTGNAILDVLTSVFVIAALNNLDNGPKWLSLALLTLMIRLVSMLYTHSDDPIRSVMSSLATLAYIALPIGLMGCVAHTGGAHLLLLMFVLIWLNDTGAFVVGSLCGRHRLFERISPKKSWEGFFGGMAFAIIAAIVAGAYVPQYFKFANLAQAAGLGVIVTITATYGDLIESCLKRNARVKDSGHLLPGHGGMLDRIDSLLLVAPATFIYIYSLHIF